MRDSIELRLLKQAKKLADIYTKEIQSDMYDKLYDAMKLCREYHLENKGNWGDLYEVILWEEGIWEYGYYPELSKELQNMWKVETSILMCNCYLACEKEKESIPQDLEIVGENIPQFVEFLEENLNAPINYKKIGKFWSEKMCY